MTRSQYLKLSAVPWFVLFLVCVSFAGEKCEGLYEGGPEKFSLATGSPGELGLVKVLAEAFNSIGKTTLCWQKAGSGESLKLLKDKKVDMIMVHAPAAEKKAVEEGWATKRISSVRTNSTLLVLQTIPRKSPAPRQPPKPTQK